MRASLFAALLISSAAIAQPYAEVGFGSATAKVDVGSGMDGDVSPVLLLGAGYRFSPHFALEASYLDADAMHSNATTTVGTVDTHLSTSWEAKGFGLFAIGTAPLGRGFSVLGKFGAYRLSTTTTSKTTLAQNVPPFAFLSVTPHPTEERSFWAPSLAVGVQYSPTARLHVRLMYQQMSGNELDRFRMLFGSMVVSF